MGFVKAPEEVERIRRALSRVEFHGGQALSVTFLTEPAVVAELLPPGLEPARRPVVGVTVSRFTGGSAGAFAGGTVSLRARHGEVEGNYSLAMYMDSDAAILFGRSLYGEPKKACTVGWSADGDHLRASITRDGVELVALDVELEGTAAEVEGGVHLRDFNFKSALAADCAGLAGDAALVLT